VQGVNACFGRDMQFERKLPKSGLRELHFEHSDCFLDNDMYTFRNKCNYVVSFLNGCLVEMPGRKVRHEKAAFFFFEGVLVY
jgi:hypothetical protein